MPIGGWLGVSPSPTTAGWTGEGASAGVLEGSAVGVVSCREEADESAGADWLVDATVSVVAAEPPPRVAWSDRRARRLQTETRAPGLWSAIKAGRITSCIVYSIQHSASHIPQRRKATPCTNRNTHRRLVEVRTKLAPQ